MSSLQLQWNLEAKLAIFVYFPLCILLGLLGAIKWRKSNFDPLAPQPKNTAINFLFGACIFVFLIQCLFRLPPAFTDDPSGQRLEWGLKYVHVITEIVIRTAVLMCMGQAISRGKLDKSDLWIMAPAVIYSFLVVSRGHILEMLIYVIFAVIFIKAKKNGNRLRISKMQIASLIAIWAFFIVYGEWRQGSDFSISDYGQMLYDNHSLAWIFGYFLVNYDNLALLIMENFRNDSFSNVFGALLQTLQIKKYEALDDYLYVGRFNAGTEFRLFVLDHGPWIGGVVFVLLWVFWVAAAGLCRYEKNRAAILIYLAYVGFCFPVTGRIEQPPYLFPLLFILVLDRYESRKAKKMGIRYAHT